MKYQINKDMAGLKYKWDFIDEEGRHEIHEWSDSRQKKLTGVRKSYHELLVYTFSLNTLKSFIFNFNVMVLLQMCLAAISVYIFQRFDIFFNVHVSLFVSPIVFPLAFSINTDFQRREKVLEDLANFKSAGLIWYFSLREWKQASGLSDEWMNAVHQKLRSLLFHLREYLLTNKIYRRKFILRAMYEDFSDANQLIEQIRASNLPANTSIVSRVIHLLNMMCLSFERLRVIREYRSPRSIRSFNKVLILFLPIILGPYFVWLGKESKNNWSPYYISVLVAAVFGALQGVQDKLDDPFDGMSEDDINLETIDEWTFNSLEATVNRTFTIGRFQVNVDKSETCPHRASDIKSAHRESYPKPAPAEQTDRADLRKKSTFSRPSIKRRTTMKKPPPRQSTFETFDPDQHPFADVLDKIQGDIRITRRGPSVVESPSDCSIASSAESNDLPAFCEEAAPITDLHDPIFENNVQIHKPPISLSNLFQPEKHVTIDIPDENKEKTISFADEVNIIDIHEENQTTTRTPLLLQSDSKDSSRFKLKAVGGRVTSTSSTLSASDVKSEVNDVS